MYFYFIQLLKNQILSINSQIKIIENKVSDVLSVLQDDMNISNKSF